MKHNQGRPIVIGVATLITEPSRLLEMIFHDCLNKCIEKAKTMGIQSPIVTGSRDVVNKLNTIPFHHYNLDQIFSSHLIFHHFIHQLKMDSF